MRWPAAGGPAARCSTPPTRPRSRASWPANWTSSTSRAPLAVGHGRGRGVAVLVAHPALRGVLGRPPAPEEAAVGLAEAVEGALLALGAGRGEEDVVAPDDGRGVAPAGDRGAPEDVGALAVPADGQPLPSGEALPARPAEARPLPFGPRRR